ncbi:PREDICTED: mediator of RNA polymerase II transcription subunit 26 [Cyprinodon variegatus]|uniref:mediator of RNA polymerase II transcription subunit 26 n=1 Tax=Cyprinodon variegatus TaxID=28743 RepID=UPI0007428C51|nr:PREDICTED: mediator of RNA polymerase II transcription subunit 26 [Cyprinodon variegatus]
MSASPRVMRDRLLQAIDSQSNICNMKVVVEVISCLERYPVSKEVLEETRLGKLINDIRKQTKNEDLAKRAKKLLRNWQKLIEPGQGGSLRQGLTDASWSFNGSAHPCSTPSASPPALCKTGPKLKARGDFNNCSPTLDQISNRKRRCDKKGDQLLPTKKPKITHVESTQPTIQLSPNGLNRCFKTAANIQQHQLTKHLDNNKPNKVPVHAVKPHPSASLYSKPPSTLMHQQVRCNKPAPGGQHQPRSSNLLPLQRPQNLKQEAEFKKNYPKAQNSAGVNNGAEDVSGLGDSTQSFRVQTEQSRGVNLLAGSRTSNSSGPKSGCGSVGLDEDDAINDAWKKKRQKYRAKEYAVNLDRQITEDCSGPARKKDRRLTFDPLTGQIKHTCFKETLGKKEGSELQSSEQLKPNPPVALSPFQQADWKEVSRSEIFHSHLTQKSNILSSSGVHAPGAHSFTTEVCKRVDHRKSMATETHILASDYPAKDLPGISREINKDDLNRLQRQRWSGVNGCYDTKGNWYDWTECISLDPDGDESRLNILPYVCLD